MFFFHRQRLFFVVQNLQLKWNTTLCALYTISSKIDSIKMCIQKSYSSLIFAHYIYKYMHIRATKALHCLTLLFFVESIYVYIVSSKKIYVYIVSSEKKTTTLQLFFVDRWKFFIHKMSTLICLTSCRTETHPKIWLLHKLSNIFQRQYIARTISFYIIWQKYLSNEYQPRIAKKKNMEREWCFHSEYLCDLDFSCHKVFSQLIMKCT